MSSTKPTVAPSPPRLATNMNLRTTKTRPGLPTPSPSTATTSKYKSWKPSTTEPTPYDYFHKHEELDPQPLPSTDKVDLLDVAAPNHIRDTRKRSLATPCPSPIVSEYYDSFPSDWKDDERPIENRFGRGRSTKRDTHTMLRLPSVPRLPALDFTFKVDDAFKSGGNASEDKKEDKDDANVFPASQVLVPPKPIISTVKPLEPRKLSNKPGSQHKHILTSSTSRVPTTVRTRVPIPIPQFTTTSILERLSPISPSATQPFLPLRIPGAPIPTTRNTERKPIPRFPSPASLSPTNDYPHPPVPSGGSSVQESASTFPIPGPTPGPRPRYSTNNITPNSGVDPIPTAISEQSNPSVVDEPSGNPLSLSPKPMSDIRIAENDATPGSRFSEDYDFESATSMTAYSGQYSHMPFPLPPADIPPLPPMASANRSKSTGQRILPPGIPTPTPPLRPTMLHRIREGERGANRNTEFSLASTTAATYNSDERVSVAMAPLRMPSIVVKTPVTPRAFAAALVNTNTTQQLQAQGTREESAPVVPNSYTPVVSTPTVEAKARSQPPKQLQPIAPVPLTPTSQRALLTPLPPSTPIYALGPTTPTSQRVLFSNLSREFPNFRFNNLGRERDSGKGKEKERTNGYAYVHRPVVYSTFKIGENSGASEEESAIMIQTIGETNNGSTVRVDPRTQGTTERKLLETGAGVVDANLNAGRPVLGSSKQKSSNSTNNRTCTPPNSAPSDSDVRPRPRGDADAGHGDKVLTLSSTTGVYGEISRLRGTSHRRRSRSRENVQDASRPRLNLEIGPKRNKKQSLPPARNEDGAPRPLPVPMSTTALGTSYTATLPIRPKQKSQVTFDADHVIDISPISPAAHPESGGVPQLRAFSFQVRKNGIAGDQRKTEGQLSFGAKVPPQSLFDRPAVHRFPSYRLPEIGRSGKGTTRAHPVAMNVNTRIVSTTSSALGCGCHPGSNEYNLKGLTRSLQKLGIGKMRVKAGKRVSVVSVSAKRGALSTRRRSSAAAAAGFGAGTVKVKKAKKAWWEKKDKEKKVKKRRSTASDRYYRGL